MTFGFIVCLLWGRSLLFGALPGDKEFAKGTREIAYDYDSWAADTLTWTSGLLEGFALNYGVDTQGRPNAGAVTKDGQTLSNWEMTFKGLGTRADTLEVSIPGAPGVTISYTGGGQHIDGIRYTVNAVQTYGVEFGRDAAGRMNAIDSTANSFDSNWQRDAHGRIDLLTDSSGITNFAYRESNGSLQQVSGPEGTRGFTFNDSGELEELEINGLTIPVTRDASTGAVTGLTHGRRHLLTGGMHTNATLRVYLGGSTNAIHTVTYTNRFDFVIDSVNTPALAVPNTLVRVPWSVVASRPGPAYEQNLAVAQIDGAALFPPQNETVQISGGRRTADAFLSYDWDTANRTRSITNLADGTTTEHVYDAQSRRVQKTVYQNGEMLRTHRFVYDGWLPVCEEVTDAWGNLNYRNLYIFGAGPDGSQDPSMGATAQLALIAHCPRTGPPQLSAPVYNHRWDVVGLVDVKTGNVVAEYAYTPFGELLSATGARANQNPFRFAGAYFDAETETYYFGYRHYHPRTMQWISRDPIGEAGGLNLFAYADNDPINGVDVLGLDVWITNEFELPPLMDGNGQPLTITIPELFPNRFPIESTLPVLPEALPTPIIRFGDDGYIQSVKGIKNIPAVYSMNREYYGNHWYAFETTFNPMSTVIHAAFELNTGVGIRPFNSNKELSDDDRFGNWTQIGFSSIQATGYGIGGAMAFRGLTAPGIGAKPGTGVLKMEKSVEPSPGVTVRKVGSYWIKEVDPNASPFFKWYGERSLRYQSQGLAKLGDMAPSYIFKNGKLITRDAGTYTPGSFWKTWYEGSLRLGTPMNDIRPRNIGANGIIFDPSLDPIARSLYWTAGVGTVGTGLYGIYELLNEEE